MTRILFVCTGNTCRSPMAEVIARDEARRRGMDVRAYSAGLMPGSGSPAAEHARALAETHGCDLSAHRSRGLTPDLLGSCDLVLGMTRRHVDALRHATTAGTPRLVTSFLPEGDPLRDAEIADPFGGDRAAYERTWSELESAIAALLDYLAATAE